MSTVYDCLTNYHLFNNPVQKEQNKIIGRSFDDFGDKKLGISITYGLFCDITLILYVTIAI